MSPSSDNQAAAASPQSRLANSYAKAQSIGGRLLALRWQRDELGVALFPDRLIIARVGGGWRRQWKHKEIISLAPAPPDLPPWQPALAALAGKALAGALAGAEVTVVLSNHFVRYALVPWSELLKSEEEQLAFARHRFARVHGSTADGWTLRVSRASANQPRLACGVDSTLINALDAALTPVGNRYSSLQPHLMASFNRWRALLDARPCWFVVAEPGLLCVAMLRDGQWQSMRAIKVGADWTNELPALLSREECLVESQADCDDVLLFAPDHSGPLGIKAGKWKIQVLRPTLLPDMLAGVDAQFAVAVGV